MCSWGREGWNPIQAIKGYQDRKDGRYSTFIIRWDIFVPSHGEGCFVGGRSEGEGGRGKERRGRWDRANQSAELPERMTESSCGECRTHPQLTNGEVEHLTPWALEYMVNQTKLYVWYMPSTVHA